MQIKKLLLWLGLCVLILAIGIAGIMLYDLRAPKERLQNDATQITFWTVSENYADYMRACAQSFNAYTDGEKIDLDVQVYSRSFIVDQINKSLLNDEQVPDLVDIRFTDMHQFVNSAEHSMFLYPLGSLFSEQDMPKATALDAFSFNNTLLALPYGLGEIVLFVNENVLFEQEINVESIQNWDDFFALGEKLGKNGISLLAMDVNNWDLLLAMMLQKDPNAANLTDLNSVLRSEAFVEVYDRLKEAIRAGWITIPEGLDIYNQRFYDDFQSGVYLCVAAPLEYAGEFIASMPALSGQVRICPLPDMDTANNTPLVAQYGTAILSRSKNIRLAKRFLGYARLGEARYREMVDALYVRSISSTEGETYHVPQAPAFLDYFGSNALNALSPAQEHGYSAASALCEVVGTLVPELLSLCDD